MSQSRAEETTSSTAATTEGNTEHRPILKKMALEDSHEPLISMTINMMVPLSTAIESLLEIVEQLKIRQQKQQESEFKKLMAFIQSLEHAIEEHETEQPNENKQDIEEDDIETPCNNAENPTLSRSFGIFAEKANQTETHSCNEENEKENDSAAEKTSENESDSESENTATQSPKLH